MSSGQHDQKTETMTSAFTRYYSYGLACVAVTFIVLTAAGTAKTYSGVPYWDMWDGYLEFYIRLKNGDYSAWWDQYNEHRIILSRILFYIDLAVFKGSEIFLLIINNLLPFISIALLGTMYHCAEDQNKNRHILLIILSLLAIMLFSWHQQRNFFWSFQNQFFIAQQLPLAAFFCLSLSAWYDRQGFSQKAGRFFWLSCTLGILSVIAMASGLTALPLMTTMAFFLRIPARRKLYLFALSGVMITAYFWTYTTPEDHHAPSDVLLTRPLEILEFTFLYLGSPFYHSLQAFYPYWGAFILGRLPVVLMTELAGIILSGVTAYFLYRLRNPESRQEKICLALIFFIIMVGAVACVTGQARINIGVTQALSSRYTTPGLMAWAALFLVTAIYYRETFIKARILYILPVLIAGVLFPAQLLTIRPVDTAERHEKLTAALSLELGAKDKMQTQHLFPRHDLLREIAEHTRPLDISIFHTPLLKGLRDNLGQISSIEKRTPCEGELLKTWYLLEDENFRHIAGWFYNRKNPTPPPKLEITDSQNRIIGYALPGLVKETLVMEYVPPAEELSGFKGYIRSIPPHETIYITDPESGCFIEAQPEKTLEPYHDSLHKKPGQ